MEIEIKEITHVKITISIHTRNYLIGWRISKNRITNCNCSPILYWDLSVSCNNVVQRNWCIGSGVYCIFFFFCLLLIIKKKKRGLMKRIKPKNCTKMWKVRACNRQCLISIDIFAHILIINSILDWKSKKLAIIILLLWLLPNRQMSNLR